jgi:CRISPR-associated protein Csh2
MSSKQNNIIKNRIEILFLYDATYINPNGDPLAENRPRIDEETGINIVTDVRLKRTIRDYLAEYENKKIFVIGEEKESGKLKTRKEKINEIIKEKQYDKNVGEILLSNFIDLRLFGATIPIKKEKAKKSEEEESEAPEERQKGYTWIGPVQFRFGRSLHKVKPILIKGTTVLPSGEEKAAGTFTETYVVPYSLICFYGIINEKNAKKTKLTVDDVELMFKAMWNGTKNLITRSKIGQMPRLLFVVKYKEMNYHIGDLDRMVKIKTNKNDEELREINELKLDLTELINALNNNKAKIESISIEADDAVTFIYKDREFKGKQELINILNGELNATSKSVDIKPMNINI